MNYASRRTIGGPNMLVLANARRYGKQRLCNSNRQFVSVKLRLMISDYSCRQSRIVKTDIVALEYSQRNMDIGKQFMTVRHQ
ncbi:hypothetical protein ACFLZ8_06380 [Planctomycetota bacterium]